MASPENVTLVTDGPPVVVTEEELEAYRQSKEEVAEMIKKEGSAFFMAKGPATGLVNQGATCYMNSLLQSLFMTVDFRQRLYEWAYSGPEKDGAEEECIPLQLQRLFARLQLTSRAAVSTKDLTTSFGWTAADAFRQHDVQELCRVLFDALEDATPDYSIVEELFKGQVEDYLRCSKCGHARSHTDPFLDLELTIAGCATMEDSLRKFVTPETLSGDNMWYCEACAEKVEATKGFVIKSLPTVLTFHLKRFVYDLSLMRRVKLHDSFEFPATVDMAPFVPTEGDTPSEPQLYDLYSVMIHTGTAMGGHYFAYVKPPGTSAWLEFNDAIVKDLGEDGERIALGMLDPKAEADKDDKCEDAKAKPVDDKGEDAKAKPVHDKGEEDAAKPEDDKDGEDAAAGSPDTEAAIVPAGGDASDAGPDSVPPPAKKPPQGKAPKPKAMGSRGNAYMLLYRRRDGSGPPPVPDVPVSAGDVVRVENAAFDRIATSFAIKQKVVELEVHYQPSEAPGAPEATPDNAADLAKRVTCLDLPRSATIDEATDAAYAAVVREGEREAVARHNTRLRVFVPSCSRPTRTFTGREADSLQACGLAPAKTMVLETRAEGAAWDEYNPDEMVVRVVRWESGTVDLSDPSQTFASIPDRLTTVVKVPGDQEATAGSLQAAIACSKLGVPAVVQRVLKLGRDGNAVIMSNPDAQLKRDYGVWSGEDVVVEVIRPDETVEGPSEAMDAYDSARNVVNIAYNLPEEDKDAPEYNGRVTANLRQPLASIKADICKQHDLDPEDHHLKRNSNRDTPQLKDEDATLRGLGLVDGSCLYLGTGAPLRPNEFLLKVFQYHPSPKPRFEMLSSMPAAATQRVGALKRRLADALAVPPANIRLRQKTGKEAGKIFRDGTTVRQNIPYLADGKEFAVQVLDHPEHVGPKDMVLSVRAWRPTIRKVRPNVELVVKRSTTVGELRAIIRDAVLADAPIPPEPAEGKAEAKAEAKSEGDAGATAGAGEEAAVPQGVGIAKYLPMDGKLTLKKLLGLNWNDASIDEAAVVSSRPLGLRDGSMVICRDEVEVVAAKAAGQLQPAATKASSGPGSRLGTRRSGFGTGSSGTRAGFRPERGLTIRRRAPGSATATADDAAAAPDAATDDKAAGAAGGPCDSCGCTVSDSWNTTAVEGMSLCATCSVALGGM